VPPASVAIAKQELRILRGDPASLVLLLGMPLVLAVFTLPVYRAILVGQGHTGASGAEQAVPGMAALFGVFTVQFLGLSFFREHGWGTWDRLRASQVPMAEILLGKVFVSVVLLAGQQVVIFTAGALFLGLRIRGSLLALALVGAALSLCLVAFALASVAVFRSMQQLSIVVNIGSLLFAGVGGALVPLSLLPWWTAAAGVVTPVYWAMRGYDAVVLDGAGAGAVLPPVGALLAQTVVLLVVALLRFRVDETKRSW
jgi:ABC-2 type transport system permease protein